MLLLQGHACKACGVWVHESEVEATAADGMASDEAPVPNFPGGLPAVGAVPKRFKVKYIVYWVIHIYIYIYIYTYTYTYIHIYVRI